MYRACETKDQTLKKEIRTLHSQEKCFRECSRECSQKSGCHVRSAFGSALEGALPVAFHSKKLWRALPRPLLTAPGFLRALARALSEALWRFPCFGLSSWSTDTQAYEQSPRQTKPKKGPKRKVHEFRPFL